MTIKQADKDTIEIMLLMTENCNLSCRYCYESHKSEKKMSLETAKGILDKEFDAIAGTEKKVVIQFFGGEPMLEFDTIRDVYNYIHSRSYPNYEYCFVVTNGTLFNEERKRWAYEHKEDFICGLSLDGTKEIHDYNRCNSYDLIDFGFFAKTWPEQKVKMTVSPDMLGKLGDGVIHCHELGFGVLCNLADGLDWSLDSSETLKQQLKRLAEYYIEHPEKDLCTMLKMPLLHIGLTKRDVFPKWCGAGEHIHAYGVDGNLFPCQLFMGISGKNTKIPPIENVYPVEVLPEKCRECILYGSCPTCIGTNAVRNYPPFYHTDVECRNIKIQFLATSFVMYEKYKRGHINLLPEEEYVLLRAIHMIQNEFADL